MNPQLVELGARLGALLLARQATVSTAESCTGGLIAAALTETAGSSVWFHQGVVTYSNTAKQTLLHVSASTLAQHGAVSQECAAEMATGAAIGANALLSIAVTGIAGPTGATLGKPVGMVCFGFGVVRDATLPPKVTTQTKYFDGDRAAVREQAVRFALLRAIELMT
jgi:nicotinamide-nucleotide amidase